MTGRTVRAAPLSDEELRALPALIDATPVARALGCSKSLVYERVRSGEFPFEVITFGKLRRFRRRDLLDFLGIDTESHAA